MPQAKKSWFTIAALDKTGAPIKNAASSGGDASKSAKAAKGQIKLFGVIGGGFFEEGVTASEFIRESQAMLALGVKELELLVDSPGGSVSVGWAIFNWLEQLDLKITATVLGTAASMASVIILAADEILIPENGAVMIHRATGGGRGTHEEVKRIAETIQQFEDQIVAAYTKRTKQNEASIRSMMATSAGTWLFGKEAVAKGFADRVLPGVKAAAFAGEWREHFDFLPTAIFDRAAASSSENHSILNLDDMNPKEIQELIANGIKSGLADHVAETKKTIDELRNGIKADITDALKPELEGATKGISEKVTALETKLTDLGDVKAELAKIGDLAKRVETAENLVKKGVAGVAGGGSPGNLGGAPGDNGGGDELPKNEKELEAALAKLTNHSDKRALIARFDAAKNK